MKPDAAALWASPKQIAATTGHHTKTVLRWIHEGRVIARRSPGGSLRVQVDADGWPLAPT